MASKFNWVEIEKEYTTANPPVSLPELSKKYNISISSMKYRCKKSKWIEKREKYFEKLLDKTRNKISDNVASTIARAAINLAVGLEQASNELYIHEEVNMFGKLIKKETETVRVSKLTSLIKSLTLLQKVEIEREKLEIEKSRKVNKNNIPPAYFDDIDEEIENDTE